VNCTLLTTPELGVGALSFTVLADAPMMCSENTHATYACRTKMGGSTSESLTMCAMLDKSKRTQVSNILFTNHDPFSLAQSSYNPEDFASREGAGHAVLLAEIRMAGHLLVQSQN
jgi:hypothetical protein